MTVKNEEGFHSNVAFAEERLLFVDSATRDRCYVFKKYFRQKSCEKMALFTQTTASLKKNCHNIGF
jgi:hypothetical protein